MRKFGFLRLSFVSFIFLCYCSSLTAQIQRKFWGLELSRSTKYEVKSFLSSNDLKYDNLAGFNAISTDMFSKLAFDNYMWSVTFQFYHDTLYEVQMLITKQGFSKEIGRYDNRTDFIFHDLREKLANKYNNFDNPYNINSQTLFARIDNQTVIDLEFDDNGNVILTYSDLKLAAKAEAGNDL